MLEIPVGKIQPPFLIHSDLFKSFHLIKNIYLQNRAEADPFLLHFDLLCGVFGRDNIILPAFNYDFPTTRCFDVESSPSQVGALTEYVLNKHLLKRTETPIFSFLTNTMQTEGVSHFPFGAGSVFETVFEQGGTVVFYGAGIEACTYLHFVEQQFGPPVYRYDKRFEGVVVGQGRVRDVSVEMHVRPRGVALDYDWPFLLALLRDQAVIVNLAERCFAVRAQDLSNIWGAQLRSDPFSVLSAQTRPALRAQYEQLGRRFQLADFEEAL